MSDSSKGLSTEKEFDVDSIQNNSLKIFKIFYELINNHFDLLFDTKFWGRELRQQIRRQLNLVSKSTPIVSEPIFMGQIKTRWMINIFEPKRQYHSSSIFMSNNLTARPNLDFITLSLPPTRLNGGFFIPHSQNVFKGSENPITLFHENFWELYGAGHGVAYFQLPDLIDNTFLGNNLVPFLQFVYPTTRFGIPGAD